MHTTKPFNHYVASKVDAATSRELRLDLEAFHAEYCAALDNREVEKWPEFFCEDALYRVTSRENAEHNMLVGLVYAEGRDMMIDRAIAIAHTQMFAPRYTQHMVSNVRIVETHDDGRIEAEANFLLLQTLVEGPSTVHLAGRYYDTFVREQGRLLLQERQVIYDTAILANDLVYPV